MAVSKIYTREQDEDVIKQVLTQGFDFPDPHSPSKNPKWRVLRLALAVSLCERTPPEELDTAVGAEVKRDGGREYFVEQIASGAGHNYPAVIRALLETYHRHQEVPSERDSERRFLLLLTAHIRRGLSRMKKVLDASEPLETFLARTLFPSESHVLRSDTLQARLADLGLEATIIGRSRGPRMDAVMLKLSSLDEWETLRGRLDDLAFGLNLRLGSIQVEETESAQIAHLFIPRPERDWDVVDEKQLLSALKNGPSSMVLPVCLGVDALNSPFFLDLWEAPHLLVAGSTGSGKSTCLHSIILSIALGRAASTVEFCLIDPKRGMEFTYYRDMPRLYRGTIATSSEDAEEALKALESEMGTRQTLLAEHHLQSLEQGLKTRQLSLPYIVVVIEELADLMSGQPELEKPIVRLATVGRAVGIHLVLATQRPDAKTFSGQLRSNIYGRVALRVVKAADSQIILDAPGAELLRGNGEMLVRLPGKSLARVQGFYVPGSSAKDLLAKHRRDQ